MMRRRSSFLPLLLPLLVAAFSTAAAPAAAQGTAIKPGSGGKPRSRGMNPLEVKRLDAKLEEVRDVFLRDTTNLIISYENLGQFERAKVLLESLAKLDPKNEPIRAKLNDLNAKILESQEFRVDVDPEKSWQPIGTVTKDRALRIRVEGECRWSVEMKTGPDGAVTANPVTDLVAHVPLGAVMGVIAPTGPGGPGGGNGGDKPPRPFVVGSSYEKPADRDGVLYLKVNAPPGTKWTGKPLTALVSGPERNAP